MNVIAEKNVGYQNANRFKSTNIGKIPSDWNVTSLSALGTPVRGGSPRPAGDSRFFGGTFIPWLTVAGLTNLSESTLYVTSTATCLTEAGAERSRRLSPGTLIIANSGATLGVAKILALKCCANDGIAALLKPRRNVSIPYLVHFINSKTEYLREIVATGNGQPNLNTDLIGRFLVPLPPTLAEQEAIASALSDTDALIESLEHLLAKKRQIKQGAMQELLTGRRRLAGFDDSWRSISLGDIGVFLKGSGVRKDEANSGDLPCVRYGEIYTRHSDHVREFHSWISHEVARTAVQLQNGDLLFAGSGETKEDIGKCIAFCKPDLIAYAGGDIVILRPHSEHSAFLGYYLNSCDIAEQKASKGQGDAVVHISATALGNIECSLPSFSEQEAIADCLSSMDQDIAGTEKRLAKARQLKQAMMQQLLTGRIRLV